MLLPNQIFHFDTFRDPRGTLCVLENSEAFSIRRVFFISHVPSDAMRGNHASLESNKIIVLTAGSCKIDLHDGDKWRPFVLETPMDALFVPRMTWIKLYDFSADCVLTVLADQPYDRREMLDRFDVFLKKTGE